MNTSSTHQSELSMKDHLGQRISLYGIKKNHQDQDCYWKARGEERDPTLPICCWYLVFRAGVRSSIMSDQEEWAVLTGEQGHQFLSAHDNKLAVKMIPAQLIC